MLVPALLFPKWSYEVSEADLTLMLAQDNALFSEVSEQLSQRGIDLRYEIDDLG